MPGIIQGNFGTYVLPKFLCELFTQDREYLARINDYADATNQAGLVVFNSRKKWTLRPKVAPSAMVTLRNFYLARTGGIDPFWFYDFSESTPYGNYDDTGTDTNGRFLVRFEGSWQQTHTVSPVGTAAIALVELIPGDGSVGALDYSKAQSFFQFAL